MNSELMLTGSELLQLCQWHANVPEGTDLKNVNFLYVANLDKEQYLLSCFTPKNLVEMLEDTKTITNGVSTEEKAQMLLESVDELNEDTMDSFNTLSAIYLTETDNYAAYYRNRDNGDTFHAILVFSENKVNSIMLAKPASLAYSPSDVKKYALTIAEMFNYINERKVVLAS